MKKAATIIGVLVFLLMTTKSWAESFLNLPLQNAARITCDFCCYKFRSGSCHSGIDYGITNNTEIVAAAAGVVEKVVSGQPSTPNKQGGYGNYIRIRHPNGYRTIYGHLAKDSIYVSEGDNVEAGQLIALSDNSGYSTGPHLHFEVRDSTGKKVNPYGDDPAYPNCGPNALWVTCPPEPYEEVDEDGDSYTVSEGDCDDANPDIHPGAEERCNNIDDNCVGGIDEDPEASESCEDGIACTENYCSSELHVCSQFYVHALCDDGDSCTTDLCLLTGCGTLPKDDDLDGFVDEACGGDDCDDSDFDTKPGAAESCNGFDDDCDDEVDEDWKTGLASDLGNPCSVGRGECQREGVFICTPDGLGVVCSADPGLPSPELCDGRDNNCDGLTDEDWPDLGLACGTWPCEGIYYCTLDGLGIYCNVAPGNPEVCDGIDNDCDMSTDENPEANLSCDDSDDCTIDSCEIGVCQNVIRDRDSDTHPDDLCGGDDCNDVNSTVWSYALTESRITNAASFSGYPALVWTETEFGLAFVDNRDGNYEIYFSRINSLGEKIGDEVRVTNTSGSSLDQVLAWSGSEFGLAFEDAQTGVWEIYFTRLDSLGQEIGDEIKITTHTTGAAEDPTLAWAGSEFGLAFTDSRSGFRAIYFTRVSSDGIEIGDEAQIISPTSLWPSLVWSGTEYGVTYDWVNLSDRYEVRFVRLTWEGVRIGGITLVSGNSNDSNPMSNLIFSGSEYAETWLEQVSGSNEVWFVRLSASGTKIGTNTQITNIPASFSTSPSITQRNGEYGLAWYEFTGLYKAHFTRLSSSGVKFNGNFQLTENWTSQNPVIVSTGTEYGIAWQDDRDGNGEIYFARLGCNW